MGNIDNKLIYIRRNILDLWRKHTPNEKTLTYWFRQHAFDGAFERGMEGRDSHTLHRIRPSNEGILPIIWNYP